MGRKLLAIVFVAVAVAALCYAARGEGPRPLAIMAAMIAFFAAASLISRVGKLAPQLKPWIGKRVRVQVWRADLPGATELELERAFAIGPGLHLYLRRDGGKPTHLKIAQPRDVQLTGTKLQIAHAKYVQWAGHKLERNPDRSVPAIVMETKK